MIKQAIQQVKSKKLFVYLFVMVAMIAVAISATSLGQAQGVKVDSGVFNTVNTATYANAAEAYSDSVANRTVSNPYVTNDNFAHAATYATPKQLEEAIANSGNSVQGISYFVFARWATAPLVPVPEVGFGNIAALVVASFTSLTNMLMSISAVVLMAVGLLFVLVTRIDLISSFLPAVDWFFYTITTGWLSNSSAEQSFTSLSPLFVAIGLFVVAIVFRLSPFARKDGSIVGDVLISAFAIGALIGMSSASANNWDNGSYPVSRLSQDGKAPLSAFPGIDTGDPESYAPWSFGRVIATVGVGTDVVVNAVSGVISGVTGSISDIAGGSGNTNYNGSDCNAYVNKGLHTVAGDIMDSRSAVPGVTTGGNLAIAAYDRLVFQVLYRPAAQAAYGTSGSSDATWCRVWEGARQSDPVEQATISRAAGMYSYVVGSKDDGINGTLVNADGTYAYSDSTALAGFFGNQINTPKASTAFKFYWAACRFNDGNVSVSGAYANALAMTATADQTSSGKISEDKVTDAMCKAPLDAKESQNGFYMFGATADYEAVMNSLGRFAWAPGNPDGGGKTLWDGVMNFFGNLTLFDNYNNIKKIFPSTESINFYKSVYGNNSIYVWPSAVIGLVGTVMLATGLLPMQIGALMLQIIAILALIFFPLLLIVLILPIGWGRRAFMTVVKMFLASKFIQIVFVTFIAIAIAIVNLLNIVFTTALNSTFLNINALTGDGTALGVFISSILNALAIGIGLFGSKQLISKLFKSDVTTIKGAMSVGQNMTSSAVNGASLRELGFGQLKTPSGFGGRDAGQSVPLPDTKKDGSEMGRQDDKAEPEMPKSKDMPKQPESTDDAAKAAAAGVAAAGVMGAGAGKDGIKPESIPQVDAASAQPVTGTIGDQFKDADPNTPNGTNPHAPVANDGMLSPQQRAEQGQASEAFQNASGVAEPDVNNEVARQSSAAIESQLDDALEVGDETGVRNAVAETGVGGAALLEGDPAEANSSASEAARGAYFGNEVDNSELPNERGEKAPLADLSATAQERVHGDSPIGYTEERSIRDSAAGVPVAGSESNAPAFTEDPATSTAGSTTPSASDLSGSASGLASNIEGLQRTVEDLNSNLQSSTSIMSGTFFTDKLDSFGRTIESSAEIQSEAIRENTSTARDAASEQLLQGRKQTDAVENLTQVISAWFPNRGR